MPWDVRQSEQSLVKQGVLVLAHDSDLPAGHLQCISSSLKFLAANFAAAVLKKKLSVIVSTPTYLLWVISASQFKRSCPDCAHTANMHVC